MQPPARYVMQRTIKQINTSHLWIKATNKGRYCRIYPRRTETHLEYSVLIGELQLIDGLFDRWIEDGQEKRDREKLQGYVKVSMEVLIRRAMKT